MLCLIFAGCTIHLVLVRFFCNIGYYGLPFSFNLLQNNIRIFAEINYKSNIFQKRKYLEER